MSSQSTQHKLSLIAETTYGVTPSVTPAFLVKPITGTTLGLSKGIIESAVINPNRQVTDVRHGNRQIGGDISTELAFALYDDMLEALLGGTWTSDVLIPGTTRRSFSVLRHFTDMAATGTNFPFQLFKGIMLSGLALTIKPEALVMAVFSCFGREYGGSNSAPAGATSTEPAYNKPFDSFTGAVTINGVAVANLTEIALKIENGIAPRFIVFDDKSNAPLWTKTRVTGNLIAYFQNSDMLVAFNSAEKKALQFTLNDLAGNSYVFDLPSILPTGGQADVSGDADIMVPIPFSAIYEAGADVPEALKITRAAA